MSTIYVRRLHLLKRLVASIDMKNPLQPQKIKAYQIRKEQFSVYLKKGCKIHQRYKTFTLTIKVTQILLSKEIYILLSYHKYKYYHD